MTLDKELLSEIQNEVSAHNHDLTHGLLWEFLDVEVREALYDEVLRRYIEQTELKNSNNPSFPAHPTNPRMSIETKGLTKREYFAAIAMQGIIAGYTNEDKSNGHFIPASEYPLLMQQAHQMADELLKQLGR